MKETERIIRLLEKTYHMQPWYGSCISELLASVNSEVATFRHADFHTIIELVLHMTSWRKFVIQKLKGDVEFNLTDEMSFPEPRGWKEAIDQLHLSQEDLVAAIKQFPEARLTELVPSKTMKYTYYTLLHGIIQHDIYHIGQIALLKKLTAYQNRSKQHSMI